MKTYAPTHPLEEYGTLHGSGSITHYLKNYQPDRNTQGSWSHHQDIEFRVQCPICLPVLREALELLLAVGPLIPPGDRALQHSRAIGEAEDARR